MFSRWFGKKNKEEDFVVKHANLIAENIGMGNKLREVAHENSVLHRQIAEYKRKDLIDVRIGDPSPVDKAERNAYVARVAALHKDILEPKLKQMISTTHSLMEEPTNDRDTDQALKGTVFAFHELIRWGNMMVNEQIANQAGENPAKAEEPLKQDK